MDGKQDYNSDCKGKQSLDKFIAWQILRLSAKKWRVGVINYTTYIVKKILKSKGPKTDPWGKPHCTAKGEIRTPQKHVHKTGCYLNNWETTLSNLKIIHNYYVYEEAIYVA
jgi:hypothetical protein